MDHIEAAQQAALQQQISERLKRKLDQVNSAAQSQLAPVQHHINFTLQQAYFKCAYECFDRRRKQEEIASCVENCSVPVLKAQHHFEDEMAKFQASSICPFSHLERMNRSLMVCQDKFEAAKLQQVGSDAMNTLESCVDGAIQENASTLPHLVRKLKTSLSIRDEV
ncbi:Protein FAM136A [Linum perenne]